jgi:hypothetical protein
VRKAALETLVRIPGHEAESFTTLAGLITKGVDVAPAIAGLHRIIRSAPPQSDARLVEAIATYAGTIPASERDTPEFKQVLEVGTTLAKSAPGGEQLVAR